MTMRERVLVAYEYTPVEMVNIMLAMADEIDRLREEFDAMQRRENK